MRKIKTIRKIEQISGLTFLALNDNTEKRDDAMHLEVIDDSTVLAIVSDGVSQCTKGYIASALTCFFVSKFIRDNVAKDDYLTLLKQAVVYASNQITESLPKHPDQDQLLRFLIDFETLIPNEGQYDSAELFDTFSNDFEAGNPIKTQATFNVNLIVKDKKGIYVYYAAGGDSPSYKINTAGSFQMRPTYTSNNVSVYLSNSKIKEEQIELGMFVLRPDDELLIMSDGVNLSAEEGHMTQKGTTFRKLIKEKHFVNKFHRNRRNIDAITDDYTMIHVRQTPERKEEGETQGNNLRTIEESSNTETQNNSEPNEQNVKLTPHSTSIHLGYLSYLLVFLVAYAFGQNTTSTDYQARDIQTPTNSIYVFLIPTEQRVTNEPDSTFTSKKVMETVKSPGIHDGLGSSKKIPYESINTAVQANRSQQKQEQLEIDTIRFIE